jgi:hypothetical protein
MSKFLEIVSEDKISENVNKLKESGVSESDILQYKTMVRQENEEIKSLTKAPSSKTSTFQSAVEATALAADTIPSMVVGGGPQGAAVGFAGNLVAQGIRIFLGNQKEFKTADPFASAAYGVIGPVSGPVRMAAGVNAMRQAGPVVAPQGILSMMGQSAKAGAEMGGKSAAIEAGRVLADEGRIATPQELAIPAFLPSTLGAAGAGLVKTAGATKDVGIEVFNNAKKFLNAGIDNPTAGQLLPRKYGALESRIISRDPAGKEAQSVQKTFDSLNQNLKDISQDPKYQPADILDNLGGRIVNRTLDEQVVLAEKAVEKAGMKASQLQRELPVFNGKEFDDISAKTTSDFSKAANEAFDAKIDLIITNAKKELTPGNQQVLLPVEARDILVNKVIQPMRDAYSSHFDLQYKIFPQESKVFNSDKIRSTVDTVFTDSGKKVPAQITALLGEEGSQLSLSDIRQIRNSLNDLGQIESGVVTGSERAFRLAGKKVSDDLSAQAPNVFGPKLGNHFQLVNADYSDYSNLWQKPGVEILYAKDVKESVVEEMVSSMMKNGIKSDRFNNVMEVISNLAAPQKAQKIVDSATGMFMDSVNSKINPEQAVLLKNHFLDLVHGNILDRASIAGEVDGKELVKILKDIGFGPNKEGALELLKLGSVSGVKDLDFLFNKYKSAGNFKTDEWSQLLKISNINDEISKSGFSLAVSLEPLLQKRQIDTVAKQVAFSKFQGRYNDAEKLLRNAQDAAGKDAQYLKDLNAKVSEARKDPLYDIFKQPPGAKLSPISYTELKDTLFNPSATHAITNDYVKSISQGLRDSKTIGDRDLLRQIQNEYLTTHLADFSQVGQFNRLNPKKLSNLNSNELDRAKSLLDDKQFKALEDVIEASKMLAEAEVYGKKSKTSDELKRASTSVIKESWYAVADLIKRRNYDAATEAILNPTAFKDKKMIQGQWIEQLGKGVQRAALPATNVLMQTAQPSREQNQMNQGGRMNPSDILQFAPQN